MRSVPSTPAQPRLSALASRVRNGILEVRSDADLEKTVSQASKVRTISISDGLLTPDGAKRMKKFPQLRSLSIRGSFIDDAVLESISDLPKLTDLSLSDVPVGDSGLVHIAKLPSLSTLKLWETEVTPDGLRVLKDTPSLRELELMGRQFNDKAFESLKDVHSLRKLSLYGGSVTDEGLKYLVNFPVLESFVVSCPRLPEQAPQFTDKGLESIAKTKISRLFISGPAITDAGLKHLETMTTLLSLSLSDTDVTTEGIESLQHRLAIQVHCHP